MLTSASLLNTSWQRAVEFLCDDPFSLISERRAKAKYIAQSRPRGDKWMGCDQCSL